MRNGKYFEYFLIILNHLINKDSINSKLTKFSEELVIPKSSFYETLHRLEREGFIEITIKYYDGNFDHRVKKILQISVQPKGIDFFWRNVTNVDTSKLEKSVHD